MRCTRLYRRIVIRYFGSLKVFVMWCIGTMLTIYAIDTMFLAKLRLHSLDSLKASSSVKLSDTNDQKLPVVPVAVDSAPAAGNKQEPVVNNVKPAEKPADKDKVPAAVKPPDTNKGPAQAAKCDMTSGCPAGQHAYFLRSGIGRDGSPVICFDDNYIMSSDKKNANRGLNVVVINNLTLAVEDIKTFDVYQDDGPMLHYLQTGVHDGHLVLIATLDEASYHLTEETKRLLTRFGSKLIMDIKFRDNFVMIGQKGLGDGKAVEKLLARDTGKEFGDAVDMSGCLSLPLGDLTAHLGGMQLGAELPNCGVTEDCGPSAFSVQMYTGDRNIELPKICVNGKYVMAGGLNDAGRGLNIVVVNPSNKEVVRVGHFDTFGADSANLEIFLEMLNDGEIIIIASNDEASTKMSDFSKHLLNEIGSALIQNVKFRDMWVFVGQKGIQGFSDIEQIEFAGEGWPKPIDKRLCVPTYIKGSKIKPDPIATKNNKRREFCASHDGYGAFCDANRVDDLLTPAPLSDKTLENNAIFHVPIIVVPGLNFNALRMQLETLLLNPGIQPDMVTVFFSDSTQESALLAEVFGYKTKKLDSSTKYSQLLAKALVDTWQLYNNAKYVIVLEEEVVPSHDFLEFLAQCLSAVETDDSLVGVSTWNVNGYETVSTLPSIVYRTQDFPGLGFLLKKSFYEATMKDKMDSCCYNRTWDGWLGGRLVGKEMVVPDVSRVLRRPYVGVTQHTDLLSKLFNEPRPTNVGTATRKLTNADSLTATKYEEELNDLIKSATTLHTANAQDCLSGNGLGFYVPESTGKVYVVYYEQVDATDERILSLLSRCFNLFYVKGHKVRGLHHGLMRFSYKGNAVFLVGSATEYYKHRPADYTPVRTAALTS